MTRFALRIEYNGSAFHGWQFQKNRPSIQEHLESALSRVADEKITVFCAGRTDAGVHATHQIVHYDTTATRALKAWVFGVNAYLPPAIAVRNVYEVDDTFHARFDALSRSYRYIIDNRTTRPAINAGQITWYCLELDALKMNEAAQLLIGEHDFTSFRSSQCESKTPIRCIHSITVVRENHQIIINITANAFLHHMVRNIVGTLLEVGIGRQPPDWVAQVLEARDRRKASITALAAGLYLVGVTYPPRYQVLFDTDKKII